MTKKCYYEILNVSKTSNLNDIKKSYKKLALMWHPDKNPENKIEAEKMFKIISEAYEVLSDEEKRKLYDRYGHEGLNGVNVNESRSSGGRCFEGGDFDGFFDIHNMFTFRDPNDIFKEFFGSDPFENMFGMSSNFGGGHNLFQEIHHRHGNSRMRPRTNNRQARAQNRTSQPYMTNSNIRSNHDNHFQDIVSPFPSSFLGGGLISPFGMGGQSMFSMFPTMGGFDMFGNGGQNFNSCANFRSSSTSTKIVNGKRIKTTKIVENGSEIVTEEVDGVITNKTVNGRQVAVN